MNNEKENFRELLASFMDTEEANKAAIDIERGDALLRNWHAPQPGETLLAEVKQKMMIASGRHRVITFYHRIFVAAAAAAAVVILSVAALKVFENRPVGQPDNTYAIWTDDPDIAALSNEIDNVADEISEVLLSDKNGSSAAAVSDVEMQIIEVSADFWKG